MIPMYNEESAIPFLRAELTGFLNQSHCPVEIVVVNDGSSDGTLARLAEWVREDPNVRVINLSRNFGHQLAATAGLDYGRGEAVVLLDADLQDPLEVIHRMIERYCDGYDVVYGQREKRHGESAVKRFTAWAFYRLMRGLIYKHLPVDTGDFRLVSRNCLDGLQQMRETHRFLRGMVAWVGFPQCAVLYTRAPRVSGETKYPLRKMLSFAWTAATSFSTVALRLSLFLGCMVGLLGVEEAIRAIVEAVRGNVVPGWTSLMVVICVIGSALLICLGIVGEYIGRIYEQSKNRPLYLVSQVLEGTRIEKPAGYRAAATSDEF